MLGAIPDMRDALNEADESDESELIEMFDAFDVCATYTKSTRRLELAASVTPELVASHSRSQEGVQTRPRYIGNPATGSSVEAQDVASALCRPATRRIPVASPGGSGSGIRIDRSRFCDLCVSGFSGARAYPTVA